MKKSSGKIQAWGPSIAVRVGLGEQQQKRLSEAGQDVISAQNGSGLIDTGSSYTLINKAFVRVLRLEATGNLFKLGGVFDTGFTKAYYASLELRVEGGVYTVPTLEVGSATIDPMDGGFSVVLGRDVLSRGKLIYDGHEQV